MSLVEGGAQPYTIRILTATTSQRNVPAFGITNHLETRSVTRVIVLLTFSSFASDALGQQLASAGYSGQGAPSSPDELQQLSHCIPTLLLPRFLAQRRFRIRLAQQSAGRSVARRKVKADSCCVNFPANEQT